MPVGDPLQDATDLIVKLIKLLERPKEAPQAAARDMLPALEPGDEDIIRLLRKDRRGSFLWEGQWETLNLEDSSHSGADFALAQRLAFYTGKNAGQIDRLFRRSALYREDKWDTARPGGTYGSLTIAAAIGATTEVYSARGKAKAQAPAAAAKTSAVPAPAIKPSAGEALDLLTFDRTDMGNASRVRLLFGERMYFLPEEKNWQVWTGEVWSYQDGQAQELAKQMATEFTRQALASEEAKPLVKFAYETQNHSRIANALALLASEVSVAASIFDRHPHLLNCKNGTLDLRAGELREHRREDYLTRILEIEYDPQAKCPEFMAFLSRIMGYSPDASEGDLELAREKLDYLHLALGYSITGETSEKVVFVAYGIEDTGKTTLLNAVRSLMANYAITIPLDVIMGTDHSLTAEDHRADLKGARFAQSSETEEGQRLSSARLKRICQGSGGTITACRKYQHPISFPETHKLWIDANYRPELSASDTAAWRRLRLIPFTVQIPKSEQDKSLDSKLKAEAPGILTWLIQGAQRWYAEGLPKSNAVDQATEDWREDVNRVKVFLEEATVQELTASVPNKNLYGAYKAWSEESGERALSNRKFSDQMKTLGHENKRTNSGYDWLGFKFRLPE